MCIICYAPAGVKVPEKRIRNMFTNNPDGSGIMWKPSYRSKVQIRKGFMTVEELIKAWNAIPTKCEKAIHCRIATAGKVGPACCHPFPVRKSVDRMRKVKDQEDMVLMHNGVISYCNPPLTQDGETSDTMNFAADVLYTLRFLIDKPKIQATLGHATNSKLLIFRNGAKAIMIGDWVEADGAFYSNTSYNYDRHIAWRHYGCCSSYYGEPFQSGKGSYNWKNNKQKNKMTNIFENEVYETDIPVEMDDVLSDDVRCIPVYTMYLNIDEEEKHKDKFFEDALAYVEDSIEDMGFVSYEMPCVVRYGKSDAIKVQLIGSNPRDEENNNQLFGLEVFYSYLQQTISESELWSHYNKTIKDLNLDYDELENITNRKKCNTVGFTKVSADTIITTAKNNTKTKELVPATIAV